MKIKDKNHTVHNINKYDTSHKSLIIKRRQIEFDRIKKIEDYLFGHEIVQDKSKIKPVFLRRMVPLKQNKYHNK